MRGRNHYLTANPTAPRPAQEWIDHYRGFCAERAERAGIADKFAANLEVDQVPDLPGRPRSPP